ncbi:folate family ECF transporter S component [Enterococcus gallinarum]|uniref:folate family ECF transporter S component n=1 Tax=Enterococcus gallinarum TaxID=1353 RepID=UPI003D6AA67A
MLVMKRKVDAHMIAVMGLLIALMVVLSQILGFETAYLKLTFTFVPELIMGMLFGPFWTAVGASVADIAGMILFPKSAYFFGFTINAFVGGLIYGYFFYRKEVTWKRAATVVLLNTLLITLILTPIWLAMMLNIPLTSWAIWTARLMKAVIMFPIQTVLIDFVGRAVPYKRLTRRFT